MFPHIKANEEKRRINENPKNVSAKSPLGSPKRRQQQRAAETDDGTYSRLRRFKLREQKFQKRKGSPLKHVHYPGNETWRCEIVNGQWQWLLADWEEQPRATLWGFDTDSESDSDD